MAKSKGLSISVKPEDIVYTSIQKSKDNYNSARMVSKVGDKAYMNISVEWEGDTVPSFAMDLMGTLQASELETGRIVEGRESEYAEYMGRGDEGDIPKKTPKKEKKMNKEDSDLEDE